MKKRQRPRSRHRQSATELVEFVSPPGGPIYIQGIEGALNGIVALYRERNKFVDAEATVARNLPMLIERTNLNLFSHGLQLLLEKEGLRLLHRADRKTPGTTEQKARRAEKAIRAELDELARALLDATE
jgi:hypothetical protein